LQVGKKWRNISRNVENMPKEMAHNMRVQNRAPNENLARLTKCRVYCFRRFLDLVYFKVVENPYFPMNKSSPGLALTSTIY
jgi:hypothetical protein